MAEEERPVTIVAVPATPSAPSEPIIVPPPPAVASSSASTHSHSSRSSRTRLRRPESVMSVSGQWPVPQVIVYFNEMKIAWGREAIADMGKTEFMKWLFMTFVWVPPEPGMPFMNAHYEQSAFARNAVVFGTFYHQFGKDDSGPVMLGSLGWSELIRNVARIELMYNDDE